MLARLATKKAKPDGHYFVADENAEHFIQDFRVSDLPGNCILLYKLGLYFSSVKSVAGNISFELFLVKEGTSGEKC